MNDALKESLEDESRRRAKELEAVRILKIEKNISDITIANYKKVCDFITLNSVF